MEVSNWITLFTGLIAGLGIGSVITATIQHFLRKRETAFESQRQDLEKRYRVIILLMYAAFEFESNETALRIQRPDLKNQRDVLDDLIAEWYNMLLFASEKTLKHLHLFINQPTLENLKDTANSMRDDLGRGQVGRIVNELRF